jgi:hypothetical protein
MTRDELRKEMLENLKHCNEHSDEIYRDNAERHRLLGPNPRWLSDDEWEKYGKMSPEEKEVFNRGKGR